MGTKRGLTHCIDISIILSVQRCTETLPCQKSSLCRIRDLVRGELCHPHRHRRAVSPQPNRVRDRCEQQVLTDLLYITLVNSIA
jgi:hypothetical protein